MKRTPWKNVINWDQNFSSHHIREKSFHPMGPDLSFCSSQWGRISIWLLVSQPRLVVEKNCIRMITLSGSPLQGSIWEHLCETPLKWFFGWYMPQTCLASTKCSCAQPPIYILTLWKPREAESVTAKNELLMTGSREYSRSVSCQ